MLYKTLVFAISHGIYYNKYSVELEEKWDGASLWFKGKPCSSKGAEIEGAPFHYSGYAPACGNRHWP